MARFKDGDMVVRLTQFQQDDNWLTACNKNHTDSTAVLTVKLVPAWGGSHFRLAEFSKDCTGLHESKFRLATGLEVKMGCALPAEDHIAEKDAHVECLREKVAELERDLDTTRNQLDVAMRANNRLSDDIAAANDQRDAAVIAAKSLGADAHQYKRDLRGARYDASKFNGLLEALLQGTVDVDLDELGNQLMLVAKICEEQDNGADAQMLADAALVVVMVGEVLKDYDAIPYAE